MAPGHSCSRFEFNTLNKEASGSVFRGAARVFSFLMFGGLRPIRQPYGHPALKHSGFQTASYCTLGLHNVR